MKHFAFQFLFLLCCASAAWATFGFNSPVTIDHTKVPSTQTNFPVLISVTDARFKDVAHSGNVQSSSGFDIRPYSDSTCSTALTYELERYNATTGEVVMWVKIGSLSSSSDTVIYLGYGDASLTTDGSDGPNTFSNSFLGVYHLKDGTTLNVNSATGSNNGTNHGVTAAAGQIDGCGGFASASSQYVDCGTGMNPAAATLSAWVKATSFPNAYNTMAGINNGSFVELYIKSTGKLACFVTGAIGTSSYDGTGSHTLSSATWYLLHLTYDSSAGLVGYVNAASDATATQKGNINTTGARFDIGKDPQNAGRFWNGALDEVRFASVARSANWITTEYNNQNSPGTFETLGTEVSGCGPTPTATATFTPTPTATATFTPTPTDTPTPTATFTPLPTATFTPSATFTPTPTDTPTPTATATFTPTATATFTPTPTPSATYTPTPTPTPLAAPWFLFIPH